MVTLTRPSAAPVESVTRPRMTPPCAASRLVDPSSARTAQPVSSELRFPTEPPREPAVAPRVDPAVPALEQQRVHTLTQQLVDDRVSRCDVEAGPRLQSPRVHPDVVDERGSSGLIPKGQLVLRPQQE